MSTFDQRNRDFCKALTDMQFAYIEAEAENAKLRELLAELYQCSRQVGCDHCGDGYRRTCSVLNHLTKTNTQTDSNE